MSRRQWIGATLAGVAGTAAVAVLGPEEPAGKSGAADAVVLGLAVVEEPGSAASEIAESYARRVEALSNGSIRVETRYWSARVGRDDRNDRIEAAAIDAVRRSEVELALVPAPALDGAGVTTLRALHAPFLVTSAAHAARVTTGPVSTGAQAGLRDLRLTGLGLVPEGLYRAFGYLKPLVVPADFAGVTVRAPVSRPMRALLTALGARPIALGSSGPDTTIQSGFAVSAGSLRQANEAFPQDAYTAAGVALFPKIDVIVTADGTLERLSAGRRAVLRRAAADVRRQRVGMTETAAARAFCAAGGTVVPTPPAALSELRRRTAPVVEALRRDPATRQLVAAVQRLDVRDTRGLRACDPTTVEVGTPRSDLLHPDERARLYVPEGSYRRAFSVAELRAAGADVTEAEANSGLVTLTFYDWGFDSSFVVEWPGSERRPPCRGRNDLVSRRVRMVWNPATPCSGYLAFRWKLDGADLAITELDPRTDRGWTAAFVGTWKRVDCTPTGRIRAEPGAIEEERRKALPHGFCN